MRYNTVLDPYIQYVYRYVCVIARLRGATTASVGGVLENLGS